MKQLLLNAPEVRQKIKRIAYEIYENNFEEEDIVLAGIIERGYYLAKILKEELDKVNKKDNTLFKVKLDKAAPLQSEISLDIELSELHQKTVILIDDVLNTGRTLAYSLKPFLNIEIKKLQTAVLVDRNHRTFPVAADYTGYELSTTLQEHINVDITEDDLDGVYLH